MRRVAPTEKDTANQTLEKRLWAAADQFRANSAQHQRNRLVVAVHYNRGLIFVRFVGSHQQYDRINAEDI